MLRAVIAAMHPLQLARRHGARLIRFMPERLRLPAIYTYKRLRGNLPPSIRALPELAGTGGAIDVGAHYGVYSYALARLCPWVEAFEPQRAAAEPLVQWRRANVHVHHVALSNRSGTATLYVPQESGQAALHQEAASVQALAVPLRRLDEYQFRSVSFVKVDVEGHEYELIEGAEETIRRERPVLLIEIEQRHLGDRSIDEVFAKVCALGYTGSFTYRGETHPLSAFSYQLHQKPYAHRVDAELVPDYVNDFVFRPAERAR